MTKTTDVEIYGQRYTIKGEADEASLYGAIPTLGIVGVRP